MNERAIQTLKSFLNRVDPNSQDKYYRIASQICDAKETVISRYAPMFSAECLDDLTVGDFKSFLLFKNNQHWDSLHRQGNWITNDMSLLKKAIKLLVNENILLRTRLNQLRPSKGEPMVKGLGRAVITAILQIVNPDKYGVLNNTAEAGMKELGLWPDFARPSTFGQRYETVNQVLLETASKLDIDLWTLDMLWWRVEIPCKSDELLEAVSQDVGMADAAQGVSEEACGLERHLHDFLIDNWEHIELGKEWNLLEKDGEIVGSHYNTHEVGEIDLLARHSKENFWLVIELKRNQLNDDTVGQILRYMGWVRRNLATEGEKVKGLIVGREINRKLQYALDGLPDISCMTYEVSFHLNPAAELE